MANKYELNGNEVDEKDVLEFADKINAIFVHTSAKKNIGINDLLYKISRKLIEKEEKVKEKNKK